MVTEGEHRFMATNAKRVHYKETTRCPLSVLLIISLASTVVIDLLVFVFTGTPKLTIDAFQWVVILSIAVFVIAYFHSSLRYTVKLKVSKGIAEDRIFLSLRGVGKGTWLQIPVDCIVSCRQATYRAPIKGFLVLLLTSNAPFKYCKSSSIYPLPGYHGSGIYVKYKRELGSKGGFDDLLIPTKNPKLLCELLIECKSECS